MSSCAIARKFFIMVVQSNSRGGYDGATLNNLAVRSWLQRKCTDYWNTSFSTRQVAIFRRLGGRGGVPPTEIRRGEFQNLNLNMLITGAFERKFFF